MQNKKEETTKKQKNTATNKKKANAEKSSRPKKKRGKRALEVVISVVLVAGLGVGCVYPLLQSWKEIPGMTEDTWLQDNAQHMELQSATEETSENETLYESVSVKNTEIYNGSLILVNNTYAYQSTDEADLQLLFGNKSESYYVSGSELSLREPTIQALNAMLDDFLSETGHEDIIIISGYRTQEQQQELYDADLEATGEETSTLVAMPGYSEHQTGYAMDFSLFDGEYSADYDGTGEYSWIDENCSHYGFILRYPEDKTETTAIRYEPWHYRYIGVPHAFYIMQNKMCLEEYMELLRQYPIDNPLSVTNWDGKIYQVYYVPAAEGDSTYVMVPPEKEHTILGNNVDGFIVTVDTGETGPVPPVMEDLPESAEDTETEDGDSEEMDETEETEETWEEMPEEEIYG